MVHMVILWFFFNADWLMRWFFSLKVFWDGGNVFFACLVHSLPKKISLSLAHISQALGCWLFLEMGSNYDGCLGFRCPLVRYVDICLSVFFDFWYRTDHIFKYIFLFKNINHFIHHGYKVVYNMVVFFHRHSYSCFSVMQCTTPLISAHLITGIYNIILLFIYFLDLIV